MNPDDLALRLQRGWYLVKARKATEAITMSCEVEPGPMASGQDLARANEIAGIDQAMVERRERSGHALQQLDSVPSGEECLALFGREIALL